MTSTQQLKIGIALGSGAARGWAHFGVLRALHERGIEPGVVAGTSVGALVGAAYASGQLDALEEWVLGIDRLDVLRLMDAGFAGGVIKGKRVMRAVEEQIGDRPIESLERRFVAVAADLNTGRELRIAEGSMLAAARASCGMPGLFSPVMHDGHWVIDGGIVDPVPVSACRALGAELVIAVNLNSDFVQRRYRSLGNEGPSGSSEASRGALGQVRAFFDSMFSRGEPTREPPPDFFEVVYSSLHIMQDSITRSRLDREPPFVEIRPHAGDVVFWEFHRARELIEAGRRAVEAVESRLAQIQ